MGNFIIGKVDRILSQESDQVIEAKIGEEHRVKAFPLFTIQQVKLEDEVLLIKVAENFDTYVYLLLRLNQEFKYHYNQMILGFNDEKSIIIEAPEVIIKTDNLKLDCKKIEPSNRASIDISKFNGGPSGVSMNQIKYSNELEGYVLTASKNE